MTKVNIICLTPVKNEEWILEKFLSAASLWADVIIVADQNSTDRSVEIAQSFDKVKLIHNKSVTFNEPERQRLLINESRKIPGKNIIIALDADEFLSGNFSQSEDWDKIKKLPRGTVIKFKWPFINSKFDQYWAGDDAVMPFGFVDDGSEHIGKKIHSKRVPFKEESPIYEVNDFVVMHYQFTDWKRMESKHRWYQCYERVQFPEKSDLEIFRTYSHMYRVKSKNMKAVPEEWFDFYLKNGVDIDTVKVSERYYWDAEVDKMLSVHGAALFKNIDLKNNKSLLLSYLRTTKKSNSIVIKVIDKLIKMKVFRS